MKDVNQLQPLVFNYRMNCRNSQSSQDVFLERTYFMTWKLFGELIEIKAKTASVFPFIIGLAYSVYHFKTVNWLHMGLFFIAMFLFNMVVDMFDNYMDYHHATEGHDYKDKTNIIGREGLSLTFIRNLIIGLTVLSGGIGIFLTYQTGWPLLLLGLISFGVGFLYSGGPRPLSSLPVGELASGITMGYLIPLITVYLNIYDSYSLTWQVLGQVFFICLPGILPIANLLFANNICDVKEDRLNLRVTLPHCLGKSRSLRLFQWVAYLPFVLIVLIYLTQEGPWTILFSLLVLPMIHRQTKGFLQKQVKTETFPLAIKNLAMTLSIYSLTFLIGSFF